VENDSVVRDLVRRSLLRNAGYDYLVTQSPDVRGIDVALLYSPFTFKPVSHRSLRVKPVEGMRPTRDILYVAGEIISGDTLHVFVVHAPSQYGGERRTRPYRRAVVERLMQTVDSIRRLHSNPRIIVMGDFNETHDGHNVRYLGERGLHDLQHGDAPQATSADGATNGAMKKKGRSFAAPATYKYKGVWECIDHIMVSPALFPHVADCHIHAPAFLLEPDETYGGMKPYRTYYGMQYREGFSDHLPLVARFRF